jgi:hypothetical protein
MVKNKLFLLIICCCAAFSARAQDKPILMNMVHHNPGEAMTQTKYLDDHFLKSEGYNAKVYFLFEAAQFGIDWQKFDPAIFPAGDTTRHWVNNKARVLDSEYTATKKAGLKVYCMIDMIVLPAALVKKYKDSICDEKGRIDISKAFTEKCVRSLLNQMFDRFPQLDGLVVRTGETYLNDAPFYKGNNPLIHGLQDHVTLLKILRDEVCVKRNKEIFYRTWDAGQLHSLPKDYLEVSNQVEPHPKLYFSIKHTMVDFWRGALTQPQPDYNQFNTYWINEASQYGVPFNPCLGIGKHKQVVEVQCQREYEGKGAHPNYIAAGVIDGFDELKGHQKMYSLNQFKKDKHYVGVWTWARGGGWGGPFINNEFWCELNAGVMARWTKHPQQKEYDLFADFARSKGLPEKEIPLFHKLCILSAKGVMQGQYSEIGNAFILWTRDDAVAGLPLLKSFFDKIIQDGKTDAYLQEKHNAVLIWQQIDSIAGQLHFKDAGLNSFVRVSCTYGLYKYTMMAKAYEIMLRGYSMQKQGINDFSSLSPLIADYDNVWAQWLQLKQLHNDCPTLYKRQSDYGYGGMDKTINSYRVKIN